MMAPSPPNESLNSLEFLLLKAPNTLSTLPLFLWTAPVTFVPHFDLSALLRFKLLWPELASRTFQPAASASLVR